GALRIGVRRGRDQSRGLWLRRAEASDELFGLANGQFLSDDGIEDAILHLRREAAQCSAVTLAQTTVGNGSLDPGSEVEKSKRVGDGRAGRSEERRVGKECRSRWARCP